MAIFRFKVELSLPASEVWGRLVLTETLAMVADGLVTYDTVRLWPKKWRVGQKCDLEPRLLGIPLGSHVVEVVEVSPNKHQIKTREHGETARIWNHTMRLVEEYPDTCVLIDEIEVKARHWWQVPTLYLFIAVFYRHRHRRWRKMTLSP